MKNSSHIIERLIPGVNRLYGQGSAVLRQHLLRYRFAAAYMRNGDRVLDAGCGSGYGTRLLAQTGAKVTGVDRAREAIDYARSIYADDRVTWVCSSLEDYSSPEDHFHRITCFETIEHVNNPGMLLRSFSRILRKDGLLLCSVPIVPSRHFDQYHLHDFTEDSFLDLLDSSGFHLIDRLLQEFTILTIVASLTDCPDLEPQPL